MDESEDGSLWTSLSSVADVEPYIATIKQRTEFCQ